MLLGAVADDYTGAADLASMLSEKGVRTVLFLGVEAVPDHVSHQAAVVALKSRSIPASEARAQSLRALEAFQRLGARQIYFKYCSTFDSSAEGNIGPVTDALMEALDVPFTVAVPALPVNGRTQYEGYLFVGDHLLSESHMRHHPIHPMTDSHLVRHLQAQTSRRVGLLPYTIVREGAAALRLEIDHLREQGVEIALVDVLSDADLLTTAEAVADLPLVTGGSGLGMALPEVWARSGLLDASVSPPGRSAGGNVLILSGSCSAATLAQLDEIEASRGRGIRMDVARLLADFDAEVERLYAEAAAGIRERGWALVASSAGPEERGAAGKDVSGVVEAAHRELATKVVGAGLVSHLVVAGGETSGAVTAALRLNALEIERVLDPGVPIMRSLDGGLTLTLKSGNFGSRDFFTRALNYLQGI